MSAKVVLEVHHSLAKVKMVFDKHALVSDCRLAIEKKLQRIDPNVDVSVRKKKKKKKKKKVKKRKERRPAMVSAPWSVAPNNA
jgi:ABC-type transporter Mla maintaining outer membrane lipid asymmetry ATPase subunit MlaF